MKTPDIEIYIKEASIEVLSPWLKKHFSTVELPSHPVQIFNKGKAIKATVCLENTCSELTITPHASGKAFTSIWIKNNISNWENDEACAKSLLEEADLEVRCSASGWQEEEDEGSAQWLLLTRSEQKLINW